jgi:uncharacterized protein (TIGR02757 family)
MIKQELIEFLNDKVNEFNSTPFIETDPIQIPHQFEIKEDIEISGFLTATIAWGNRKMIIKNSQRMVELMDFSPYDFIMNHSKDDLAVFDEFVHRTFNGIDLRFFIESLKNIYSNHGGMEAIFEKYKSHDSLQPAIHEFKKVFFEIEHEQRTMKHVSDPTKGSSAKRINMMLRWFCRSDNRGVDFGIWKSISPSILSCPLDVHSGRTAREFGLLTRKQNDAKAVKELDSNLRQLDSLDPVKYDFALFGLGAIEKF